MTLDELLAALPGLTPGESHMIVHAYAFAEEAHRPVRRKSGEPYFVHVASVAGILAQMGVDAATITAGLLHDVVEDTDHSLQEIKSLYGAEVAALVDGVTKIDTLQNNGRLTEPEYLRKTLLATRDDVRVLFIKLADRLHNMRTLGSLKPHRQIALSQETMELFAPLATRLGIWRIKSELEELAFRYLEPEHYRTLALRLQFNDRTLNHFIEHVQQQVETALQRNGIQATLYSRPRNLYHIYKDMAARGISLEESFDVRGIRIIVDDLLVCYQVLGILHQIWKPVPGKFNDYIGAPKDSFYQSLHTTVFHDQGSPFEVQIRTVEMDYRAEYGIAAYWRYKGEEFDRKVAEPLAYLRTLIDPAQDEDSPEAFLQSVMETIDSDRIYALTPRGDIVDLPSGATPLDFAYHIHTEVGDRCRAARVNGKLVPLNYKLQKGDQVSIFTVPRGGPNLDWLDESLGYATTPRARDKIKNWFRKQNREKLVSEGREALNEKLHQFGLFIEAEDLASDIGYDDAEDLLAEIGRGSLRAADIAVRALDQTMPPIQYHQTERPPILGASGYALRLARCCHPAYPDSIVGYITREARVSVHRSDCPALSTKQHFQDRLIPLGWGRPPKDNVIPVPVELRALDRPGMLAQVSLVTAAEGVNLKDIQTLHSQDGTAIFHLVMEVEDYTALGRILNKAEAIDGVLSARRRVTVGEITPLG